MDLVPVNEVMPFKDYLVETLTNDKFWFKISAMFDLFKLRLMVCHEKWCSIDNIIIRVCEIYETEQVI